MLRPGTDCGQGSERVRDHLVDLRLEGTGTDEVTVSIKRQVGVFLVYVSSRGRALIGRRLYPPDTSWSKDVERLYPCRGPDQVEFAAKATACVPCWSPHRTGDVLDVACSNRVRINQG